MPDESLFAVVLAAGEANRFGSTKQLAEYEGQPLVRRAVRAAEAICGHNLVLVVGNDWQDVAAACEPLRGFMVMNEDFADGIGGSLSTGVSSVSEVAGAVLIMLADQPLVSSDHLQQLVDAWRASPDSIVASAYAGTEGPPVIFPGAFFASLTALCDDRGARSILDANPGRVSRIRFEGAATDIDTPADLDGL